MPKKRLPPATHPRRIIKSLAFSLVLLSLLFFIRIFQSTLNPPLSPPLLLPARPPPFAGTPKLAFLFLVRNDVPLDFLWHAFFTNAEVGRFSVYVHSKPGLVFDEYTTRSSFFYGTQLKRSVQVVWGEPSMIEAERLLFEAALEDPANQRFVLLSDSCIPLYNFSYIYNYVISSSKSFVDSFLDTNEHRYDSKMSPTIPETKWRKGSQWITLNRYHAEIIVEDTVVLSVFKNYCKRLPEVDINVEEKQTTKTGAKKQQDCIPDEHFVQTLFSIAGLENEVERRTLTYTTWNQSVAKMNKQAWHPLKFKYEDASSQNIQKIKDINHVYYETEFRTEWCQANGTSVPCFLFARKFSRGAAMRLLSSEIVGALDTTTLLSLTRRERDLLSLGPSLRFF